MKNIYLIKLVFILYLLKNGEHHFDQYSSVLLSYNARFFLKTNNFNSRTCGINIKITVTDPVHIKFIYGQCKTFLKIEVVDLSSI